MSLLIYLKDKFFYRFILKITKNISQSFNKLLDNVFGLNKEIEGLM